MHPQERKLAQEQKLVMVSNHVMAVNPPSINDVIKGRGNGPNLHAGNIAFRKFVCSRKDEYRMSSEFKKRTIVRQVIDLVHSNNPPGRFLTAEDRGIWKLMDYRSILRKVAQALRDRDQVHQQISEDMKEATGDGNITELPRMIDTTPPPGQMRGELEAESTSPSKQSLKLIRTPKRGRDKLSGYPLSGREDDFHQTEHRVPTLGREEDSNQIAGAQQLFPRLGGDDNLTVHKVRDDGSHHIDDDSDIIAEVQAEMALIREQVAQLSKSITSVEQKNNSGKLNDIRAYHRRDGSIGFGVDR